MRSATEPGPRTTLTDKPQRVIGQPNLSSADDKNTSLLGDHQSATLFVIRGMSKGLEHQLTKAKNQHADIEIDDPQASVLHCVLTGTKSKDMVRLYDLASDNGTYVEGERRQAASLSHFSEFRIGSTVFQLTIVSKHAKETT